VRICLQLNFRRWVMWRRSSDLFEDSATRALMAGTIHFLADRAAFAPGKVVQPGCPPSPLAPPVPPETSGTRVTGIMRVAAVEVITCGMVPLLSFADFAGRMSTPNGHFESALASDLHRHQTIAATSAFLFHRTSTETGTRRGP
jgi:hypothetical protein